MSRSAHHHRLSRRGAAAITLLAPALLFLGAGRSAATPARVAVSAARGHALLTLAPSAKSRPVTAKSRDDEPRRLIAYAWARRQAGKPYCWGGTGPSCFDCSGLVASAWRHAGISLPRTTYAMLASPLLVRIWHPRMGDLAFFGSGHVELFRKWGWTFGAHDYGSPVGLVRYGYGWAPTAFYRVRRSAP